MSIFDLFKKKKKSSVLPEMCEFVKNGIRMEADNGRKAICADGCKIGGRPYLPADFVWPTFTSKEDPAARPLSFFCQINLSEIKPYDRDHVLPDVGMLYFFYECDSFCWGFDPDDRGAARVFYFENTDGFVPFDLPKELPEDYVIPEIAVRFTAEPSYPNYEEFSVHCDQPCGWEDYEDSLATLGVDTEDDAEGHKLLGYADLIQDEMLSECERVMRGMYVGDPECYRDTPESETADILEKARDWTLLLQLGTIETDEFEWMFGDCGMLYYYIKKQDLAARSFENIWFSVQCG